MMFRAEPSLLISHETQNTNLYKLFRSYFPQPHKSGKSDQLMEYTRACADTDTHTHMRIYIHAGVSKSFRTESITK
jgi:hypothetical protein